MMKIIGSFCPECGRRHDRENEMVDPDIHNHECRSCGGDLAVEPVG